MRARGEDKVRGEKTGVRVRGQGGGQVQGQSGVRVRVQSGE